MLRTFRVFLPLACAALASAAGPAGSLNGFAAACYQRLARADGNLIFSPYSLSTALSMTLAGARGGTAREIAAVLRGAYPDPAYHDSVAALVAEVQKSGNAGGDQLHNASALWVDRGFRIQSEFQRVMEKIYHAPLTPLDFSGNAESAREQINAWTGRQTRERIRELFAPGTLDSYTRLVLSTAIYFHGKWQIPFKKSDTQPAPFRIAAGGTRKAPFMNQTGRFLYAEPASLQILEMRYSGGALAFDVLLPRAQDGLPGVEKALASGNLDAWLSELRNQEVEVSLPRFRAESAFSLKQALSEMGMPSAFSSAADFSGIDDRRDLMLSQVRHKAFVDVNEEGTEAAAATGVAARLVSMQVQPRRVFRADHPFVFLIRDTRTGAILFAGRLANPV